MIASAGRALWTTQRYSQTTTAALRSTVNQARTRNTKCFAQDIPMHVAPATCNEAARQLVRRRIRDGGDEVARNDARCVVNLALVFHHESHDVSSKFGRADELLGNAKRMHQVAEECEIVLYLLVCGMNRRSREMCPHSTATES